MKSDSREALSIMYRSRFFEEKLQEEFSKGTLYGTTHLSIGQEASHTGLCLSLEKGDWIVPTHRCHGFNIAGGSDLFAMFSELLGSKYGLCKGLGGSMHMTDTEHFNLGSSAVVGSGVPLAGGAAFALKRQGRRNIAVAVFGDGASSRGSVHEMMNLASVWKLPLLFFMENNHYGMSAPSERMIASSSIAERAKGYAMAYSIADGNDVEGVMKSVRDAREYILNEGKPYFLEVNTYRLCGHSKSDKRVYRTREEEEMWKKRDPISLFVQKLTERGEGEEEETRRIEEEERERVENAWEKALSLKDDILTLSEAESYVIPEGEKLSEKKGELHSGTYREAIREAIREIMREDERVTLMGEDIGAYGGCFGVSGDLYKEFPERILETPVSEEAFTGLAFGAAMLGERPMEEIMYGDFMTLASDGIINHGAKTYFMSSGQLRCPVVIRTAMGGGTGHGAQHTSCPEAMFMNTPGLKICAPSTPWSAKALLKAAKREECPVLFLEHKALYKEEGEIGDESSILPLGRAMVYEEGSKLLLIGYSRAFAVAKRALKGFGVTFLDLCSLKPLDEEAIKYWAGRVGKVLFVEDVPLLGSVAESVARIILSSSPHCRVEYVTAPDMPLAFSRRIESATLPSERSIREAAERLLEESYEG